MKVNDPGKRITEVWLFVAVDADGDEGLPAFEAGGMMLPLIASDERRRNLLTDVAETMVKSQPGMRIEVRKFAGAYTTEKVIQ